MKIFSHTHIVVDILSNEDEETYLLQITHLFKSDNQEIFFIWLQSLSDFSMTLKIIFEKSNIYKIFFNYERYKNQMDNINTKNTIYVENIVDMYKTICGSNIAYKYTNIISYYNKFNLEKLQGLLSKKNNRKRLLGLCVDMICTLVYAYQVLISEIQETVLFSLTKQKNPNKIKITNSRNRDLNNIDN